MKFRVETIRELTYSWLIEADTAKEAADDARDRTYDGERIDEPINDHVTVEACYEEPAPAQDGTGDIP